MKKMTVILILYLLVTGFMYLSVKSFPDYFPKPVHSIQLKGKERELGRMLFFDPILSADSTVSCASCHSPYNAFAHTDHRLSHGINDKIGTRNAPALFNLAWHPTLMWDGAIIHPEQQGLFPITHPSEMGETVEGVLKKLNRSALYKPLFKKVYVADEVETVHVLKALSVFQLSLVSYDSKYDKVRKGEADFSEQESNGYRLFRAHCNTCHTEPLFSNFSYASNGLKPDSVLNDSGRYAITKIPSDKYLFKTPSLRNLSYTYPYMHDGRFNTLNEVLKHYSTGVRDVSESTNSLRKPLNLSSDERVDIIAFLRTLNDESFVFNPKNQFPTESYKVTKEKLK